MLPYEHPPAAPPPALLFKKRFFLFKKRYGPFYFILKKLLFLANRRQAGLKPLSQSATSGIKTSKPISDKRFWSFYFNFVFKTFVFSQSATSGIKTSKPISDKRDKNI